MNIPLPFVLKASFQIFRWGMRIPTESVSCQARREYVQTAQKAQSVQIIPRAAIPIFAQVMNCKTSKSKL